MANNKDFKVKNGIQPTVYHEGLGTVTSATDTYSLSATSYDSVNSGLLSEVLNITGLYFKSDGTKMYTIGTSENRVFQYSLSTAWDVSTASYDSVNYSYSSQSSSARGLFFKSDGTKMYIPNNSTNTVYQYSLSTAWDVSTASYDSKSADLSTQIGSLHDFTLTSDGTTLFASDVDSEVYQYTLSTAHDISTASYASKTLDTSSEITTFQRFLFVSPDGVTLIAGDYTTLFSYTMSTAKDLSTASYDTVSFDASPQEAQTRAIAFKSDGTKMYLAGQDQVVYQYSSSLNTNTLDLSTGSVFEITPTSDIQINLSNPADSGTVSQATLLLDGGSSAGYDLSNGAYSNNFVDTSSVTTSAKKSEFSADGTKLYVTNASTADVDIYQYDLSTAYDVSTATYNSVYFDPTGQSAYIQGFRFKPDGTKMYVLGTSSNVVYQYSLSTAWDLSTTSYDSVSLSINAQEIYPQDIAFKTDGTKMFLAGNSGDDINQYSLSTAWDLSTASFDSVTFSVATQTTGPDSLEFNANGDKVFVLGDNTVYQYSLSTAWSISTASYDSVSFDTSAQDGAMRGLRFKPDGRKMYLTGDVEDRVYEYNTATPATITYPSTLEWPSGTAPTSPAIGETDVLTFTTSDGGTSYQAVQAIDGAS